MKKKTKYTPQSIHDVWFNPKPLENDTFFVFDGSTYHKIITFVESDGHKFADSIQLEMDALKRWRVKHYQERWMEKQDLQKYYQLMLNIIKKL